MEFDLSKENIQPLRGGRNMTQLGAALQAESDVEYQKELIHQKEAFEKTIQTYDGVDPLENWYQYISWIEQSYPKHGHEGNLFTLLEECVKIFEDDERYQQDRRLCKLWIKYFDLQENTLELFQLLYSKGICTECSDLYKAWAYYYEATGDFKRADHVFQLGVQANAQPQDELIRAHQNLLFAIANNFLRGAVDTAELAEKRMALTSLRTFKHRTMVGSQRTGSSIQNPLPGKLKTMITTKPRNNIQVDIFEDYDSRPGPSSGVKPKSILDSASKRDTVHKENTLRAGVWNEHKHKRCVLLPNIKTNLQFTVHEDESESQENFKYPPNFTNTTKDDFSNFFVETHLPDPDNQNMKFQCKLNEMYCDNTEYSFEEILSKKWFQARHSKNKNNELHVPSNVLINHNTPVVLAQEDGSIVQVEEINYQPQPEQIKSGSVYATTPLKMQLSVLKVSSPHDNSTISNVHTNHVVTDLTRAFSNSVPLSGCNITKTQNNSLCYQSSKSNLPENTADEVAKAVETITDNSKHQWLHTPLNNVGINHTDSVTVHTRDAIREIHALWTGADSALEMPKKEPLSFQMLENPVAHVKSEPVFSVYSDNDHFQEENHQINIKKNIVNNTTSHQISQHPFSLYTDTNDFQVGNPQINIETDNKYQNKNIIYTVNQPIYVDQPNLENDLVTQIHGPEENNQVHFRNEPIVPVTRSHYTPTNNYTDKFYIYNDSQNVNLEETCSTQMFNFNINNVQASTPYNDRKMYGFQPQSYQNTPALYQQPQQLEEAFNQSVRQELFPQYSNINTIEENRDIISGNYPPNSNQHSASYVHQSDTNQQNLSHLLRDCGKQIQRNLCTILEMSEYKSSSSGSSNGTTLKTISAMTDVLPTIKDESYTSNRDTYKMEYEVGQAMLQLSQEIPPKKFEIFVDKELNVNTIDIQNQKEDNDIYLDQNSKNSTDTVQMATPTNQLNVQNNDNLEMMDWDEHFNLENTDQSFTPILPSRKSFDPFSPEIIDGLLKKIRFPNSKHTDRYERVSNIPKLSLKETISFPSGKYTVTKVLGKGTFGTVVKAIKVNENYNVALKYQKPCNSWEYYICCEIRHRIKNPNLRLSYMDIEKAYFSKTASLYISEFSKYGSLLNVTNKVKKATGKPMKELLIYHFATEILYIVNTLHECQIIHADIKPDNFLVMCMPPDDGRLSLQLIDFGRSIDMSLFSSDAHFYKIITTDGFTCTEMREDKPWTYQTDYFCIAATIYVLLIGDYMQVQKNGEVWSITKKLPRYLNHDLWNVFFMQMLNIESCDALPNLMTFQSQFQSILNEKHREKVTELKLLANIINGR